MKLSAYAAGVCWLVLLVTVVLFEGLMIGSGGPSISFEWRRIRYDVVGRFVALVLWCWLTWHLMLRPQAMAIPVLTWRDAVAVAIGLTWAIAEARLR